MSDCTFKTLLPHPSKVELALEQDAAEKYCRANPEIIATLHDPLTCPVEILPWLAYALSVDVWNPQWPESTKRAICANSLEMHLHKGTVGGVEDALAVLGITAEITEWWQMEPLGVRGTMTVMLWVNQNLLPNAEVVLGRELLRDVHEQINRSKRASIHYAYGVGAKTEPSGFGYGFSAEALTHHRVDAEHTITDTTAEPSGFGYGFSAEALTHHRLDAEHISTDTTVEPSGFGCGFSAEVLTHHRLDAGYDQLIITTECAELPVPFALSAHCTTLHRLEVSL